MIVSASYRTDIPAFYGSWFAARLAEGFVTVRNPYGGPPTRVGLSRAEADGFVFWTRNPEPFLLVLDQLAAEGRPFVVQMSILDHPRVLDRAVPPAARQIEVFREISQRFGLAVPVWRFDPILLTSLTPAAEIIERFGRLAAALAGSTDEVTVSFAQIYRKTEQHLEAAARQSDFNWTDPPRDQKRALIETLAEMVRSYDMRLTLCSQPDLLGPGSTSARCIDADRLSRVASHPVTAPVKGNRPGCLCAQSRDIGSYDSCAHGCVYCYAVGRPAEARRRAEARSPAQPQPSNPRQA